MPVEPTVSSQEPCVGNNIIQKVFGQMTREFIIIVTTVVGAALWMITSVNRVETKLERLQTELTISTADRYTKTAAAENALRNAILNPGIRFVDPRDPTQSIVVSK